MFIHQDLHVHTNLSFCAKPDALLKDYVSKALTLGFDTIAIANHLWDHAVPGWTDWYAGQDIAHIYKLKPEIEALKDCGMRILFGAETEYAWQTHETAISAAEASKLDFLLVPNSHTHITMPREYFNDLPKLADFMLMATDDILNSPAAPCTTIIPHPFFVCGGTPTENEATEEAVRLIGEQRFAPRFERMAKMNIALELNTSCLNLYSLPQMEKSTYLDMFRLAKKCGCKFTFGTDSHTIQTMDTVAVGYRAAAILELREDDILHL